MAKGEHTHFVLHKGHDGEYFPIQRTLLRLHIDDPMLTSICGHNSHHVNVRPLMQQNGEQVPFQEIKTYIATLSVPHIGKQYGDIFPLVWQRTILETHAKGCCRWLSGLS
jgi:hypothetical protein